MNRNRKSLSFWGVLVAVVVMLPLVVTLAVAEVSPNATGTNSTTAAKTVIKPVPAEILNAQVKFHKGYGNAQVKFHKDYGDKKDQYYFVWNSSSSKIPDGYTALYPVKVNGLLGFINKSGDMVIEPQFSYVGGCTEGLQLVSINDNNSVIPGTDNKERYSGFLGEDGNYRITPRFVEANEFSEGLAVASITAFGSPSRYGYIDHNGDFVIPPKYSVVQMFSEGLAWVKNSDRLWGCIDTKGNVVIPFSFDYGYMKESYNLFKEGLCFVSTAADQDMRNVDVPKSYIDKTGKLVKFVDKIKAGTLFDQGVAFVSNSYGGDFFMIDKTGKRLSKSSYYTVVIHDNRSGEFYASMRSYGHSYGSSIGAGGFLPEKQLFSEGLALVANGEDDDTMQFGCIDVQGNEVIKPQYKRLGFFSEGLAVVEIGDKYGYVNKVNQQVIKPKYEGAQDFQEKMAPVKLNEKWGYINNTGQLVIKPQFDEAGEFKCGLAQVMVGEKCGYIDRSGKVVWAATE